MGKIADYANVLKSKLTDLFVVYQRNDGELETKNATLEQLGDAICGEQVHATLETDDQTIIGGINENKDKVGDLDDLTTTDKSSLVGAVNEVNGKIKFKSVQGTTTSGGVIDLGLDYNDYLVLSAEVLTTYGTYYCTPVASMADSKTYARVYDENNNKVGSTSVTIWVLYYKHS